MAAASPRLGGHCPSNLTGQMAKPSFVDQRLTSTANRGAVGGKLMLPGAMRVRGRVGEDGWLEISQTVSVTSGFGSPLPHPYLIDCPRSHLRSMTFKLGLEYPLTWLIHWFLVCSTLQTKIYSTKASKEIAVPHLPQNLCTYSIGLAPGEHKLSAPLYFERPAACCLPLPFFILGSGPAKDCKTSVRYTV